MRKKTAQLPQQHEQNTTDEYISIAEAERRGYGSRTTLWRLAKSGRVTDCWIEREHRLSVRDLDRLVVKNADSNNDSGYLDLVRRTVAQAPRLNNEQKQRLRDILGGE